MSDEGFESDRVAVDCLFCRIVAGDVPAAIVARTDNAIAFRDIAPVAPTHVLVVPPRHHRDLPSFVSSDAGGAAAFLADAMQIATDLGIGRTGFRTVFNTGDDAGQSVHHVHAHLLGGARLSWLELAVEA